MSDRASPSVGGHRTLSVELGERSYPIHLTAGLPGPLAAAEVRRLRPLSTDARPRALLVTDSHVGPLYAGGVAQALDAVGVDVVTFAMPAGEASKSADTLWSVLDVGLEAGLRRRDVVVALGGGVVGDLAGLAASLLLRGVALVQVPTSLLAQVDSAVGGKTAVNHDRGKNLIGAFWQPSAVVASSAVLRTLPAREVRCGLAEALKHGLIADADLARQCVADAPKLRALDPEATLTVVGACCRIKAEIVGADEREDGPRAVLNFGHTFGHAYERLMGYGELTHGEAVALGMVWAARVSEAEGVADPGLTRAVVDALRALGLPYDPEAPGLPTRAQLVDAARGDKKSEGDGVRFVLLRRVGEAIVRWLPWDRLRA